MRVALDASRTTVARVTGTEAYARDLIRALLALSPTLPSSHSFTLYFRDMPPPDLFPGADCRVVTIPRLWTHVRFAAELWRSRPDLTFVPAHTLPFVFPGRAAVTIHDLGYKLFPNMHPLRHRYQWDILSYYSAHRAAVVLADSACTAGDLMHYYRIPEAKIRVVYPGVNMPERDLPPAEIDAARARYGLPARYFLCLGTISPRKNIPRLIEAFGRWRAGAGGDAALALAGGRGPLFDPAWTAAPGVLELGYIDEADKAALYAGALALMMPSLYEGFGFPVLEAMRCGTPVVCSTTSSLPELAGDAARLVDPTDTDAIADALVWAARLSPAERAAVAARGRVQARRFTWESAARAALAAFESVL
jgi:glycosyltransferase involved in cell wall biosynthesis